MKLIFINGTRPDIIKTLSLFKVCLLREIEYKIIHTNQHTDKNMDENFWKDFKLKDVDYRFDGEFEIQPVYEWIYGILKKETADFVIVGGDTDTSLIGGFSAWSLDIPIVHRESGVRSYDRSMHEEKNRIFLDKISTIRFAPTEQNKINLKKEHIYKDVYVTGNTVSDALWLTQNHSNNEKAEVQDNLWLLTLHRKENVENPVIFQNIMNQLAEYNKKIIYPMHPYAKKMADLFKIKMPLNIKVQDPISYKLMLWLMQSSELIWTDSGGIQEEACMLGRPCNVLRKKTDRPESIKIGGACLIDPESEYWIWKHKKKWENPYGSGVELAVAKKMIDILEKKAGEL